MAATVSTTNKTAFLPRGAGAFLRRRAQEAVGLGLVIASVLLLLALLAYSPDDPSLNTATDGPVRNLLGRPGAYLADLALQGFGLAALLVVLALLAWGWRLMTKRGLRAAWLRVGLLPLALALAAVGLAALPAPAGWPLAGGLGGTAGVLLMQRLHLLAGGLGLDAGDRLVGLLAGASGLLILVAILGMSRREWRAIGRVAGWLAGLVWRVPGTTSAAAAGAVKAARRAGRHLTGGGERREPRLTLSTDAVSSANGRAARRDLVAASRAAAAARSAATELQRSFDLAPSDEYRTPPLDLLRPPATEDRPGRVDEEALVLNARMLESVLQDFGVNGEIVKVRPGPVVTLYELEPAPGIKSSRVIGLADDIARSMSAVSARVAVVPGRNVIGIELPNQRRETVYLRELLASAAYDHGSYKLALVFGKDIGGAPVITDLARMPHLLIAGTTGSGKSVAVNAMILSLLYRLTPERCRFIMVDPKMLELSVYDGIPHLLCPVVTESKKAVVALKWTVREMEGRYRAMSKLGVRNVESYNARLAEARRKGEVLLRKVQTGFDPDTGKPVFEDEPLDLTPLPYIVVVIDEMADLMLLAGKEIESAVQRLSQMARAAGIHLIMATQRPSVDVVTGTIKANFPTRVSFHVTSKIDSRTILGEQGAEQLLGQGDMLYMANGGRIIRVHGPLVQDDEVEEVVRFLKTQGEPAYIDGITEDEDDDSYANLAGDAGDDLYRQAVALVCRERKASTSFIQRHLQIGYNRAARIIETMEKHGVVGAANHVGKREVLISGIDEVDND
jgi:S-DNA-T family DNA segregation ATPase FtsK/SpoIIIE